MKKLKILNVSFNHLNQLPSTIFNRRNEGCFRNLDISHNPPLEHHKSLHFHRLWGIQGIPELKHIAVGVMLNK